ncbi:MAG: hypothetical protein ACT4O6_07115 [Reyranella sp.]
MGGVRNANVSQWRGACRARFGCADAMTSRLLAIAVALTVMPLAGARAQWESSYRQRFIKEAQRKIPPLVMTAPPSSCAKGAQISATAEIDEPEGPLDGFEIWKPALPR